MRKLLNRLIKSGLESETNQPKPAPFQETASSLEALLSSPGLKGYDRLALEPRILLDAAGVDTAEAAMSEAIQADVDAWAQNTPDNDNQIDLTAQDPASNEILFIDAAVENRDELLSQVHPSIEVVVLHSNRDGVEQIAEALSDRSGIDAIHIVSHGRSGTLDLGSTKLTEASINGRHADEMALIRASLSQDADLLIYGCDFAAHKRGAAAVEALALATGADVAASDDLTGAATLGGDWDLEVEAGIVDALAFEAFQWEGVLADHDNDGVDDETTDKDDDNDGILDSTEGYSVDVVATFESAGTGTDDRDATFTDVNGRDVTATVSTADGLFNS